MNFTRILSLSLLFCISQAALAALVTVDPDDFPAGTDISNAFPGVSLSATGIQVEDGIVDAQIFATEATSAHPALQASTGTRIFNVNPTQLFPKDWLILEFRADFAQPTDFVSLDYIGFVDPAIPGSEDVGLGVLAAYDATDMLITQVNTASLFLNDVQTLSVSSLAGDIAYITARSQGFDTPVLIDRLVYDAVPLPATLWLFGSGLVLLLARLLGHSTRA